MGWSIGYDESWKRDIGYGVPAYCDHPHCWAEIDRGLAYVCGSAPCGGDKGCGLYFCGHHLSHARPGAAFCPRCVKYSQIPYKAKPDKREWIDHKLTHESWKTWRDENPEEVQELASYAR